MKPNFDKLLKDVQMLSQRMRIREETANHLLTKAENIHTHLEIMKQYQEASLVFSNQSDKEETRFALPEIMNLAVKNKQLENLRIQNQELDICLSEHQSALEMIMTKYREQVTALMKSNKKSDGSDLSSSQPIPHILQQSADEVEKKALLEKRFLMMAEIAREVTQQSDLYSAELESDLYRLRTENAGLRDLLALSEIYDANTDRDAVVTEVGTADKSDDGSTTPTERDPCPSLQQNAGLTDPLVGNNRDNTVNQYDQKEDDRDSLDPRFAILSDPQEKDDSHQYISLGILYKTPSI